MAYFQIIKQPSATWTAENPTLLDNEIGVEENIVNGTNQDSGKSKLGDGVHTWSQLDYWSPNDQDGDVVGPASSTANAGAVFADTTGTLLADGASVNILGRQFVGSFTTTATAAGTTTLTVSSNPIQEFTGSTTQTVVLPVVTTLPKTGFQFVIINNSSGALTVNSSGSNLVQTVAADGTAIITCVLLTGTTAASWSSSYILSGGGIGGSTGATDNAVLRADGVGGATLQSSPVSIADTTGAISGARSIALSGATSGSVTVAVPAVAGSNTVTLPAGTTDFSATGGTGQVLKQDSAGAAFTVGTLAIGSVSGLGTGVATALAINVGTAGAPVVLNGALGTPSSGTLTSCTGLPISTGVSGLGTDVATTLAIAANGSDDEAIGYRGVPQNSQSAAYELVLADSGKHIYHPVGDTNNRQYTIPANGAVAFPVGTAVTIVNDSPNNVTVVITTDVLMYADVGTITTLTIPQYNQATILKVLSTQWNAAGTAGCTTA